MKVKIAQYESKNSTHSGGEIILEVTEYSERDDSDYIRVSEIVEVVFPPRSPAVIVNAKVDYLRAAKAAKMAEYEDKIRKLMAITYDPESAVDVEDMAEMEHE